jgi:hypothetical protein
MQCAGQGADISSGKVIIRPAQPGVLCLLGGVERKESQEIKNPWLVRMDDDLTARNICSPSSTLHSLESGNWRLDTGLLKEGRYEFRCWWHDLVWSRLWSVLQVSQMTQTGGVGGTHAREALVTQADLVRVMYCSAGGGWWLLPQLWHVSSIIWVTLTILLTQASCCFKSY